MTSQLVRVRDFLRRIRCFFICCGSQLILENSQIDGFDTMNDDENDGSEQ